MSLLREDGAFVIYQIQWREENPEKWYSIGDRYFLPEYEHGENSASGECWQKTGIHGMFDYGYAATYCNKLNQAVSEGKLHELLCSAAEFRLIKVEVSQKTTELAFNGYAINTLIK